MCSVDGAEQNAAAAPSPTPSLEQRAPAPALPPLRSPPPKTTHPSRNFASFVTQPQVNNRDVTSDAVPLRKLFSHDFWGQDIRGATSHKSYRPLAALAFRCTRQAWARAAALFPALSRLPAPLPASAAAAAAGAPGAADADGSGGGGGAGGAGDGGTPLPEGLHPLPFHLVSVLLHAAVSCLVALLSSHLLARLEECTRSDGGGGGGSGGEATAAGSEQQAPLAAAGLRRRRPVGESVAGNADPSPSQQPPLSQQHQQQQPHPALQLPLFGCSLRLAAGRRARLEALLAGLLFALHPVHTEAVAGVVGQAELWCAALATAALLLYCAVADGDGGGDDSGSGSGSGGKRGAHHWRAVAGALALAWAAALCKEIGVTAVGAMALYDALLPAPSRQPSQHEQQQHEQQWRRRAERRRLARAAAAALAGALYVALRGRVAGGDHLVRIYRRVENPIAFAEARATRLLTTAHLHARYAWLLLAPLRLSADWSFACVPPVEAWGDARNLAAAALYAALAWCVAAAAPLSLARELLGSVVTAATGSAPAATAADAAAATLPPPATSPALAAARWRLFVVAALTVAPFLPAANVFFYVGTFIGERLLYAPSVGFCLLLARLLGGWLAPGDEGGSGGSGGSGSSNTTEQQQQQQRQKSRWQQRKRAAAATAALLLLAFYAARTAVRNRDWRDEERLFEAALRVCPDSAKVRLNAGILMRRRGRLDDALAHFARAEEIDPGYCEPAYWTAVTRVNLGALQPGLEGLRAALRCRYVAADALRALNRVYAAALAARPGAPGPLLEWGRVLAGPAVARPGDACAALEDAALAAAELAARAVAEEEQAKQQQQPKAGRKKRAKAAAVARARAAALVDAAVADCRGGIANFTAGVVAVRGRERGTEGERAEPFF